MQYRLLACLLTSTLLTFASARADDALDSLPPVASELRAKVVDYMRAAATIEWTPAEDIPYWTSSQNFTFKKGETYYGIPYTQFSRNNNLDSFKSQLKDVDGVQTYVGPSAFDSYWGSDCSASVSNAWKQADPNYPALLTRRLIPDRPKEVVAVGEYKCNCYDDTRVVVKENGADVMKKAYAMLLPADAVVMHYDYDGHIMLVMKNEPEKERLFICDQTGCSNGTPRGQNGRSTFRVDCEYSYDQLLESGYIPIALKKIDDATYERQLFNGENLDGWTVCVAGEELGQDSQGVFSVKDGVLRVSGEKYGGIMTTESFGNYRLTVEFKWGEKTWGRREGKARDSGILIHSFGEQNAFGGVWAKSVEANLLEGGLGDFWIVGAQGDDVVASCNVVERNGKRLFVRNGGTKVEIDDNSDGAFQWFGHDPDWQDVSGYRGRYDFDRPNDWNEMVIYAMGNRMDVYLNGKLVNSIDGFHQNEGKIQLQSEGAEILFRRVALRPWNESLD
ncbi:MAG: DUF1080 domain-containing protein [Planctomycetia bacterium]|nr:DUF1080 domain-containing protein [Planctomycetia bacterium]